MTSMNATHTILTTGRRLCRPSASAMPMGIDIPMPKRASNRFSNSPPTVRVFTGSRPGTPSMPRISSKAAITATSEAATMRLGRPMASCAARKYPRPMATGISSSRTRLTGGIPCGTALTITATALSPMAKPRAVPRHDCHDMPSNIGYEQHGDLRSPGVFQWIEPHQIEGHPTGDDLPVGGEDYPPDQADDHPGQQRRQNGGHQTVAP